MKVVLGEGGKISIPSAADARNICSAAPHLVDALSSLGVWLLVQIPPWSTTVKRISLALPGCWGRWTGRGTEWPVTACFLFMSVFLAIPSWLLWSGQRAGMKSLVRRYASGTLHTAPPGCRAIMSLSSKGTICGWFTPMPLSMRCELKVVSLVY